MTQRLNEEFIQEQLVKAESVLFMGCPVKELDRDSLIACLVCVAELSEEERKRHRREFTFMRNLGQATKR